MKNNISDYELDTMLKAYMRSGSEQVFLLDERRLHKSFADRRIFFIKPQIAAAAVLVLLISIIAMPQVSAMVKRLFTFIPGVGIVEKSDTSIYAMNPIVRRIEPENAPGNLRFYAYLENAVYSNDYLNIKVIVEGTYVDFKNFMLYKNGELTNYESSGWSASGTSFTMGHEIWLKTSEPQADDLYEIEITGFSGKLSFTLDVCSDYYDLVNIGPTDIQNDISITATASRSGDQLTVWCYPLNTTTDKITGIGTSFPSIWKNEAYIETESGARSVNNESGMSITERFIFDMPPGEYSAAMHIPYLTLVRDEKKEITIPIPAEYASVISDIQAQFSIGTVRITEIERKPNENKIGGTDILRISFAFESAESGRIFNSFKLLSAKGKMQSYMSSFNEETGFLEYIEAELESDANKISFTISDLCYYFMGEYVIPLNIN